MAPKINETWFWHQFNSINAIGLQGDGACHRVAYSQADLDGRDYIEAQLAELGLDVKRDAAGNTLASYAGRADLPPIAIGSHTDTVPYGGQFDGTLGVTAAMAIAEALASAGLRLNHPLEIINFAAEEATMAGGTTGSQAMAGIFNLEILEKAAWDGRSVREHLVAAGLNPADMTTAARPKGSLAAFVELHIEQSDRLETAGLPIAIVDGFVGIRRYAVRFDGKANHAGTTPMNRRHDALVMASPLIHYVRDVAVELGIVGTVGDFNVYPGAPNVIPERVDLIVEIRGLDDGVLDHAADLVAQEAEKLGGSFQPVVLKPPVAASALVQDALRAACQSLSLEYLTMPSGAGHDAMVIDHLCPQGIVFVPSQNGISHSKDEFTKPKDCLNGVNLLLETVLKLDESLIVH